MQNNSWARLLAYVTGLVNQRLLLQCEYLIAENRILRSHLSADLRLCDSERRTLAEIGKRLGRKLLSDVACVAKPETILGWYRRLIARKFDGSSLLLRSVRQPDLTDSTGDRGVFTAGTDQAQPDRRGRRNPQGQDTCATRE